MKITTTKMLIAASLALMLFPAPGNGCIAAGSKISGAVNVRLFSTLPQIASIEIEGKVQSRAGRSLPERLAVRASHGMVELYQVKGKTKHSLGRVSNLTVTGGNALVKVTGGEQRRYRGTVEIHSEESGGLRLENCLPLDEYLTSVVGGESLKGTPLEALKAQAVLARTWVARNKGRTLLDSTQDQIYRGKEYERPETVQAVRATQGEILAYENTPVAAFYHSCCAGSTSTSRFFGSSAVEKPYDRAVKCNWCTESNFFKQTTTVINEAEFKKAFSQGLPQIKDRDPSGRPLSVIFPNRSRLTGYEFWLRAGKCFGWGALPGTRFDLQKKNNGEVELTSTGGGHGVGLCQWGAKGAAACGMKYRDILLHYFPGSSIVKETGSQAHNK